MTSRVIRITRAALRVRKLVLVIWLLMLAAATTAYVSRFSIDNSVGLWFLEDDPDLFRYKDFTRTFGEREWIIVVIRGSSIRNPRFQSDLAAITRAIAKLPYVENALSIVSSNPAQIALKGLLRRAGDDQHTAILIQSRDMNGAASVSWMRTVDQIRLILEQGESFEAFWLAGNPVINAELNRAARRDMTVFYTAIACLLVLFGLVFLGNWRDTLVLSAIVAGSILPPLAAVGVSGAAFNMVTLMLPTILVAMCSSLAIHIINEFHISVTENRTSAAIDAAISAVFRPAFWTCATTSFGFLVLTQSEVLPIRHVGYLAAIGVWSGFLNAMLITPVLLEIVWGTTSRRRENRHACRLRACVDSLLKILRRPRMTIACSVAFFGACIAGLPSLKADTDYAKFFREGRQLNRDYASIAASGFPQDMYNLDLHLSQAAPPETIGTLVDRIERLEPVDSVLPVYAEQPLRAQFYIFTKHLSSNAIGELETRVSNAADGALPEGAVANFIGTRILWSNMDRSVLDTQLRSALLVFGFLFVLMPLLTRSVWIGLAGLFISALPVLSVLGLMGWMGLTINVATCLIGGVALSVAIDDTIFFLSRVRDERESGIGLQAAIATSISSVGRAMILTTSIMTLCFLSMGLSDFLPTAQFGVLFSAVLVLALLADLILLPCLLALVSGKGTVS